MRFALCAVVLCLLLAGSAHASGGRNIASAPTIAFGQHYTGGVADPEVDCCEGEHRTPNTPGLEYYRVDLAFGDELVIDYESIVEDDGTAICLLAPDTTDFTVGETECAHRDAVYDDGAGEPTALDQLRFIAPLAGSWVMAIHYTGCCQDPPWAYDFVATVLHRTSLSLELGKRVARGAPYVLSGTLTGATGPVAISRRNPRGRWRTIATVDTDATGRWTYTGRAPRKRTTMVLRAVYAGDASHRPSESRTRKLRVVRR